MAWKRLTDEEWALLEPCFPKQKMGRPRIRGNREILDALLYVLSTGIRWEELPECFPPKMTVYDRFRLWVKDGTLEKLLGRLRRKLPKGNVYHLDSTVKSAKKDDRISRAGKIKRCKFRKLDIRYEYHSRLYKAFWHLGAAPYCSEYLPYEL